MAAEKLLLFGGGGLFQQLLTLVPLIEYPKFCDFRKA